MFKKNIVAAIISLSVIISSVPAYANNISPDAFTPINEGILATYNTTREQQETAVRAYDRLPVNIRQGLRYEDCIIYLYTRQDDNSTLQENWQAATIYPAFLTYYEGDEITGVEQQGYYSIDIDADKINREDGENLIHEVGHFVDCTYNGGCPKTFKQFNVSTMDDFNDIYQSEKNALAGIGKSSKYNVYSAEEFWAEGFACYIMYKDRVRSECPRLADRVEEVIAAYNHGAGEEVRECTEPVIVDDVALFDSSDAVPEEPTEQIEEEANDFEIEIEESVIEEEPKEEADHMTVPVIADTKPAPQRAKLDGYVKYNGYVYHTTLENAQKIADQLNSENKRIAEIEQRRKDAEKEAEDVDKLMEEIEEETDMTFIEWLLNAIFGI